MMGTSYGIKPTLREKFQGTSLDTSVWTPFGLEFGSITVANGECTITNTSNNSSAEIGMYTNVSFPIGMILTVVSKNIDGRHSSVVGFGTSPYVPYPHARATTACTWYSRADVPNSTGSYNDENNNTGTISGIHDNLTNYQTFTIERVSSTNVKFYRNGSLQWDLSGPVFANDYPVYFSADGWSPTNTIKISGVVIK